MDSIDDRREYLKKCEYTDSRARLTRDERPYEGTKGLSEEISLLG